MGVLSPPSLPLSPSLCPSLPPSPPPVYMLMWVCIEVYVWVLRPEDSLEFCFSHTFEDRASLTRKSP